MGKKRMKQLEESIEYLDYCITTSRLIEEIGFKESELKELGVLNENNEIDIH